MRIAAFLSLTKGFFMKNFLSLTLLMSLAITIPTLAVDIQDLKDAFAKLNLKTENTAGLGIDLQPGFCEPIGSLAVPDSGYPYQAKAKAFTQYLRNNGYQVGTSQDFHPENHMSFAINNAGTKPFDIKEVVIPTADGGTKTIQQVMWPVHCVQGTEESEVLIPSDFNVQKGKNPLVDSYSAFADDGGQETGLTTMLRERNIDTLVVYGIATDYCVLYSVRDAIKHGFKVYVMLDLCRGVADETSQKAIAEMKQLGATIITQ